MLELNLMALLSFSCLDYSRVTYILTPSWFIVKLNLCVQCVGACFCPDYLVESVLNEEEFANLMVFQLPDKAQYNIKAGFNSKSYQWSAIKAFISTIQAEQK